MASIGFSPFVLDSFMVPTNISNNLSTSIQEETTCFSHIYPCDYFLQDIPLHPHFHEKTTTPPLLDTIISTSTTTSHSHPNSSSSSSIRLETSAETQAISKVVTGSMVKSREKKKKIIDISKVEKEGNKKGRKQKRKSDAMLQVITEEKKLKAAAEDHHHHMKAKKEKDNSTPTTSTTNGYVHVRARRGEATDNHSLAERVRREKISERMRLLQSLVPGCDTIRGKAQVLDAIIIYVQTIQNQFLLAKHASVGVGPMFNELEFDFGCKPTCIRG